MVFQLGSPLLDACVLAVLSDGDTTIRNSNEVQ